MDGVNDMRRPRRGLREKQSQPDFTKYNNYHPGYDNEDKVILDDLQSVITNLKEMKRRIEDLEDDNKSIHTNLEDVAKSLQGIGGIILQQVITPKNIIATVTILLGTSYLAEEVRHFFRPPQPVIEQQEVSDSPLTRRSVPVFTEENLSVDEGSRLVPIESLTPEQIKLLHDNNLL